MELRTAAQKMIKAMPGGWDAMAAALGYSKAGLENRVYERQGQALLVETMMQMQAFTQTTHFAQAVASLSGGVFLPLPAAADIDRDELLAKFNAVYAEVGKLSARFNEATADNVIDSKERADLSMIAEQIHRHIEELLRLTFQVFCRSEK